MITSTFYKIELVLVVFILVFISGCKKPGIGGDAKISGYVHVQKWNATFTQCLGSFPGKDVYVYIVYGDHLGYDKRIKTDYNGAFMFPYLYKGDYTIYCYSRDSSFNDPSGSIPVIKKINIVKYKEEVNIDTLSIIQ